MSVTPSKSRFWILGITITLLCACQHPDSVSQSPQEAEVIDRYLATHLLTPAFGGTVFCSHNVLGKELQKKPQKYYIAALCQEYFQKDESHRSGSGMMGPVALTIQKQNKGLSVLSHQMLEQKNSGAKLEDIFPATILSAAKAASNANPQLSKSVEAKAEQHFVMDPLIRRIAGTWIGRNIGPLGTRRTQDLRTFTSKGTTYSILKTDWDFLAVPILQTYQLTVPPAIEQPKPLAIAIRSPKNSHGQRGIFEFADKGQQLKLNLSTHPDPLPKTFSGPNTVEFMSQTDAQIMPMANIDSAIVEVLGRSVQQVMRTYIQQGRFDVTTFRPLRPIAVNAYSINAKVIDAQRVQVTAIAPPAAKLSSLTAGIFLTNLSLGAPGVNPTPMLVGGICRSLQPSSTALKTPTLGDKQEIIKCPTGSKRLVMSRSF
jgi:hypothetical protein